MRLLKEESARRAKARMMARQSLPVNGREHVVTVNTSVPQLPHKRVAPSLRCSIRVRQGANASSARCFPP
jgi:hypothetical protein